MWLWLGIGIGLTGRGVLNLFATWAFTRAGRRRWHRALNHDTTALDAAAERLYTRIRFDEITRDLEDQP